MLVIPKPLYWIYRRKQENKVVRTYSPGLTRFNRIFCRQLICCQYFTDSDPRQTIEDKYFAPKIPPGGGVPCGKRVRQVNCSHPPYRGANKNPRDVPNGEKEANEERPSPEEPLSPPPLNNLPFPP